MKDRRGGKVRKADGKEMRAGRRERGVQSGGSKGCRGEGARGAEWRGRGGRNGGSERGRVERARGAEWRGRGGQIGGSEGGTGKVKVKGQVLCIVLMGMREQRCLLTPKESKPKRLFAMGAQIRLFLPL